LILHSKNTFPVRRIATLHGILVIFYSVHPTAEKMKSKENLYHTSRRENEHPEAATKQLICNQLNYEMYCIDW